VSKLIPALRTARLDWPLVVVGDGSQRASLEAAARASGIAVQFTGWLPRQEALRWLRHAEMLVFPSHGPESLSRVLLEAGALAIPVAAMDTGGTRDIVVDETTGLVSTTVDDLGSDIARLRSDPELRAKLGAAARARIQQTFDSAMIVAKIEALYAQLAAKR
jgi:glycosyltransferase involved in cell wall biosynthesis